MSWPVRIVLPCEKIRRINWKRWFYSLLAVSSLIIFIGWLLHSVRSTESENSWGLFYPCLITGFVVYSFFLALRVYYYGMCLAANEAYLLESTTLRKEWSEWANQEVVIAASHLFLPADIHLEDLAAGSSCAIYKGQTMTLHKVGDVAYTEEQLFYELLSSIRATLQKLSLTCVFDVVFAYDDNYSSFPTFMECWISIGLPSNCIENHFFIRNSYESVFEKVINAKKNKLTIVISIDVQSLRSNAVVGTEYASIIMMTQKNKLFDNSGYNSVLRPMTCHKKYAGEEFTLMKTYQSEVTKTSRVLFSGMNVNDIAKISDMFRSMDTLNDERWDFELQDLNMAIGQLGDEHFWLVQSLSLYFAGVTSKSILSVSNIDDEYVFNVVKPYFKEEENKS